jgi:hypothetical protein
MHASDFIAKWRSADLTERAAVQSHFASFAPCSRKEPTGADPKRRVIRL